ncbi:DNA/RNA non-specific endonuclease [Microbacterium sp. NPDC087665]|uniref:DNA/RNA non-specific endonuclease n=1 Tax=Microbacterium sp. NPDC087665 TaxID=3364194 RepID=UPI00382EF333
MSLKPVVRSMKDSLDGMPIHIRQLADLFRAHGQKQRRNSDGVEDVDAYNHTVTSRNDNTKTTVWDPETGRPVVERGTIYEDFGSSPRGDNATEIGRLGDVGDDGGHLGAHRFFGDTPDEGIVPQAANLNRGAWKKMENEWADWVGSGHQVDYRIDVDPPGAVRPDNFKVEYVVSDPATGEIVWNNKETFPNSAGGTFDRVYSADMN